jgi:pyridoxine/pyridoxamine 5'-phosphate oxidase
MDPIKQFHEDRTAAFEAKDPMAAVCTVANVDDAGRVQVRTLVLRNVGDNLAVFINATSPKWPALQQTFAVQTYWPSVALQYRLQVTSTPVEAELVHQSWQMRPDMPKRMDWLYQQIAQQSSAIDSRQALISMLDEVHLPDPLIAPEHASGLCLVPHEIERLDLNQDNGVHDRSHYRLDAGQWHVTTLVP